MPTAVEVEQVIFSLIKSTNQMLPAADRIPPESDTKIFGQDGMLDSLATANFIVSLEERLEETAGVSVSLTDDDFSSMFEQQFVTIQAFSTYVAGRFDVG